MRQIDSIAARTIHWVFDGLALKLDRVVASVAADENWTVQDRNLRLALAFDRLEPMITKGAASIFRAAAAAEIARRPGRFDVDAMVLLYPEPCDTESARQDRVDIARTRNLVNSSNVAAGIASLDWVKLLVFFQENLLDLELRLDAQAIRPSAGQV